MALNPESGYAFLQLSLLHSLRGDYGQAEAAGRQAVALQEKFMSGTEGLQVVGGHVRVGYALYRQGRYDEAIAEFERELAFVGSHDHALRERVTIEVQQKLSAAWWRKGDREKPTSFSRARWTDFNARVSRAGRTIRSLKLLHRVTARAARGRRHGGHAAGRIDAARCPR